MNAAAESAASHDPAIPRELTASHIPGLTQGLDASSVLECYILQRTALLHGLANSTIPVRKLVLGLRYRPPSGSSSLFPSAARGRRELTLEYGPLRLGADGTHEATPRLVVTHDEEQEEGPQKHVAWENEARVYFTTTISASHFQSATYVATVTGAVLRNLLQVAVAYPTLSRRRYQPFAVYRKATNELMLKSSSDLDFVQALCQHLADVGVELSPLIPPNRWQIRLIASDIQRIQVKPSDPGPTSFYVKLYNCLNSIATANYSLYDRKELRTNRTRTKGNKKNGNVRRVGLRLLEDLLLAVEPTNASDFVVEPQPTLAPTVSPAPTVLRTVPPLDKDDASQAAQDASQAAQDAQTAAQDAQNSGNKQAAQAAKAAAEAALKAANATHNQAASMSQAGLLGGDGAVMVQTIAQCFQNPRYGLAVTNTTAEAYIFFDGSSFYQVTLTTPYLQIVPINTPLPVSTHTSVVNDADFSDYVLALAVFIFSMIGFLLLLQQVMGRKYQVIRPLYKFQRFLFDPMHYQQARTHDGILLDDDSGVDLRVDRIGPPLGKDVIPFSMGGLRSTPTSKRKKNDDEDESFGWDDGVDDDELALEMVEAPRRSPLNSMSDTELQGLSRSSSMEDFPHEIPKRMFRDPELVDLPTLSSRSKVAMPVGFGNGSRNGSLDANG